MRTINYSQLTREGWDLTQSTTFRDFPRELKLSTSGGIEKKWNYSGRFEAEYHTHRPGRGEARGSFYPVYFSEGADDSVFQMIYLSYEDFVLWCQINSKFPSDLVDSWDSWRRSVTITEDYLLRELWRSENPLIDKQPL